MPYSFTYFALYLGAVVTFAPTKLQAQTIWELGTVPLDFTCSKNGIPGLIPEIEDLWIVNMHCITYNGTVGCIEDTDGMHWCKCNQHPDAQFDSDLQVCVGNVGAYCLAEHSELFMDKLCTKNAECVPVQGDGTSTGHCQCLYGYKPDTSGGCEVDDDVEEGERSTPRTTTTTEAAPKNPFKLPLDLFIKMNYASYNQECKPHLLLNRTICDTLGGTVACLSNNCKCNMEADSRYDEDLNMCVNLVGTHCLTRPYLLGEKRCTTGADCVLDEGDDYENYSFGTCQCVYGYNEKDDGTCERDTSIPNPSTPRGTPSTEKPTTTPRIPIDNSTAMPQIQPLLLSIVLLVLIKTCIAN